jgi:membrane protease subunit (stomatin/prohibitin family)
MSIKSFFTRQFSSVIQWQDQEPELLIKKYDFEGDEIKNASKLIVAPGQGCILVYQGIVTEVITKDGMYDLTTDNHPFITTLLKLRTLFESEHKFKLYFFRTAEIVNQSWGTATPVKYVDPIYNLPVELGANGNYSYRITDPKYFFTQVAGSKDIYTQQEARVLIQSRIAPSLVSYLATVKLSYLQIDAELETISAALLDKLNEAFMKIGFTMTNFQLAGTMFDKNTLSRIGQVADITAESMAAKEAGLDYVELQKLRALRDAAKNESGLAGAGMQLGAGMEMGKLFSGAKEDTLDQGDSDAIKQLQKLKLLLNEGILTQEEFDVKKKAWLDKL